MPLTRSTRRDEQAVALEHRAHRRGLGLVGLDHREPQRAGVVAEQVHRRLDRGRAGGDEERLVDVAQRGVDLRARLRLVVHPAHLGADDVGGDADAARAAHVQAGAVDVVVAGQDREPVDRLQLGGVGLLDADDAVDLGELGEQVGRHVDRRAAGDVVEHHRRARGRARDLLEVAHDPAPVRLVVVGRDGEDGLRAGVDHALGQLGRVARVVRAGAGDDRALGADLARRSARRGGPARRRSASRPRRSCRRRRGRASRSPAGAGRSPRLRPR